MLRGPSLSCKTTLWKTLAEAYEYEVCCLPSVAFTRPENCTHLEKYLQAMAAAEAKKTPHTDLLLVRLLVVRRNLMW